METGYRRFLVLTSLMISLKTTINMCLECRPNYYIYNFSGSIHWGSLPSTWRYQKCGCTFRDNQTLLSLRSAALDGCSLAVNQVKSTDKKIHVDTRCIFNKELRKGLKLRKTKMLLGFLRIYNQNRTKGVCKIYLSVT